jgi:hypothetical protein
VQLVGDFGGLTANDPMVNFPVPDKVGIGIARGAACQLISGRTVLDYSGRVLNLASRLMGYARPSGVVADSSFGPDLIPDALREQFSADTIFVRGIADDEPLTVYYMTEFTSLPDEAKRPAREEWDKEDHVITLREIKSRKMGRPSSDLPRLVDSSKIAVKIIVPKPDSDRRLEWSWHDWTYEEIAGVGTVAVDIDAVPAMIQPWGITKLDTEITLRIFFPRN